MKRWDLRVVESFPKTFPTASKRPLFDIRDHTFVRLLTEFNYIDWGKILRQRSWGNVPRTITNNLWENARSPCLRSDCQTNRGRGSLSVFPCSERHAVRERLCDSLSHVTLQNILLVAVVPSRDTAPSFTRPWASSQCSRSLCPDNSTLHNHRRENLRSILTFFCSGIFPSRPKASVLYRVDVLDFAFLCWSMFRNHKRFFVSYRNVMTREKLMQYGCSSKVPDIFLLSVLFVMCHVDLLLGNNREISK
jgi:hypothetical protein